MSTATLVSGYPQVEDLPWSVKVRLREDLRIDLGVRVDPLHEWAATRLAREWARVVERSRADTTLVTVPAGTVSDGSSIPLLAQIVMGDRARWKLAGYVHDLLYQLKAPRRPADEVWRIVAESGSADGQRHVRPVRAYLGWLGLRAGGWIVYHLK